MKKWDTVRKTINGIPLCPNILQRYLKLQSNWEAILQEKNSMIASFYWMVALVVKLHIVAQAM